MISVAHFLGLALAMPTESNEPSNVLSFEMTERSLGDLARRDAKQLGIKRLDTQYSIKLMVGSPFVHEEEFIVDTGISDTYLQVDMEQENELPMYSQAFKRIGYGPSFRDTFLDGTQVNGYWATDNFNVFDKSFEVQFGVSTSGNGTNSLGLGPRDGEAFVFHQLGDGTVMPTYSNFLERLREEGVIQRQTVALWLEGSRYGEPGIMFGGVDHTRYSGPLYLLPMRDSHTMQYPRQHPRTASVVLDKVQINAYGSNEEFGINTPVLLNSGSIFSYLPQELVNDLSNTFNAEKNDELGLYLVDCDPEGSIAFTFSGARIDVDAKDLLAKSNDDRIPWGRCILPIKSTDETWKYSLGNTFLRSVYVIFDMESFEMGLAKAVKANQVPPYNDIDELSSNIPRAVKAPNY